MVRKILLVPEFNEERTVLKVLETAKPYVDFIIVVDDGSTDSSPHIIRNWMEQEKAGTTITLRRNHGMSGALRAGFLWIDRQVQLGQLDPDDLVITIDADGQHRPEEIAAMCAYLEENGYDLVLGRRDFSGYPRYKRVGNWGLSVWASFLSGYRFRDAESGFRAARAKVICETLLYFTGRRYGCAQELAIIPTLLGYKIDNSFPTVINYYRQGARMRDGFTNMFMGFMAFSKVKLKRKTNVDEVYAFLLEPMGRINGYHHSYGISQAEEV